MCLEVGFEAGDAPGLSPLEEEVLLPVLDFPQSHESDFELLLSSVLSHPELELELDEEEELDELEELDDELEPDVLDEPELEVEELDVLDELDELDELDDPLPQVSLLLSLPVLVPVAELPQPSEATGVSSPVSSSTLTVELPEQPLPICTKW